MSAVIPPFSFLSNLLQSLISHPKTASAINGKLHPDGSYSTIQLQLEEQSNEPLESLVIWSHSLVILENTRLAIAV